MTSAKPTKLIKCSSCTATNRVAQEKIDRGSVPVCGRCKKPLLVHSGVLTVTDQTVAADIAESPLPVLLDVWAPWCPPCRHLAPIVDALSAKWAGRVRFAKLNLDENPATATRLRIQSVPTLVLFKDGHEIDRLVGLHPEAVIAERLARATGV